MFLLQEGEEGGPTLHTLLFLLVSILSSKSLTKNGNRIKCFGGMLPTAPHDRKKQYLWSKRKLSYHFYFFFCSVWKSNFCLSFQIVTDFLGVINTSTIYIRSENVFSFKYFIDGWILAARYSTGQRTAVLPQKGPCEHNRTHLYLQVSTAKPRYWQLIVIFPKNENGWFQEAKSDFRPTLTWSVLPFLISFTISLRVKYAHFQK